MAETELAPRDVVDAGLCIGCGACASGRGRLDWDEYGQLKPRGAWADEPRRAMRAICPFSPDAANEDAIALARFPSAPVVDPRLGRFEAAYVGHVAESDYRSGGSSGGMVSWMASELLRRGLVDGVAHVVPADPVGEGRFFRYRISRSVAAVKEGGRSRYYPVEMSQVIEEMKMVPGRYAVVGIPCFIKAVNLLRERDPVLRERIAVTLGLFCGHMKSARMVESFAWQLEAPIGEVRAVDYRRKDPDRPANWYTAHLTLADGSARWQDWWHLADGDWGAGFFQNGPCDYCDDVVAETADIAFGDAWVEPYSSDGRGTNVVIVRNKAIAKLVAAAIGEDRLALTPVDAGFVAETQAAGLRHRREGLAYRLLFAPPALPLRKRVAPAAPALRRRLIYRCRRWIAKGSHILFAFARRRSRPNLYLRWARAALGLYQALAYARGRLGRMVDRLLRDA